MGTKDDKYKIYAYLKKHPGVLVSIISAFTVVTTFIFNMAIYVRTSRYLSYWGINSQNVEIFNSNQIYYLVALSVYFFASTSIQHFLLSTYDKYLLETDITLCMKKLEKVSRKNLKQLNKKVRKIKKEIKNDDSKKTEYDEVIIKVEQEEKTLVNAISTLHTTRKELQKNLKDRVRSSFVITFGGMYAVQFCFLLVTRTEMEVVKAALISGIITCVIIASVCLITKKSKQKPRMREFEKKLENEYDIADTVLGLCENLQAEYPLEKIVRMKFKDFFSDSVIGTLCIQIVIMLIYAIFLVNPMGNGEMEKKQEFSILSKDDHDYAIIYVNRDSYYLEEVYIEENVITINTSKQRIVKSDDLMYENKRFEKVEKIRVEK